jgi:hypothetical protein
MRLKSLVFVLLVVLMTPSIAMAKGRKKKWNHPGWHPLDGTLEYQTKLLGDGSACEVFFFNASDKVITFFEFEYTFLQPRNNQTVTLRRIATNRLQPRNSFYGLDWHADTKACDTIKVKLNTVRFEN